MSLFQVALPVCVFSKFWWLRVN